jgi:hypothetical protein
MTLPGIVFPPGQVGMPPQEPMIGVFYGQVVDALSLNPIPNVTVYLCDSGSFTDLLATVFTNTTGFYSTPNLTLSWGFRVSARAEGYYVKTLDWDWAEERAEYAGNMTYYIRPTKLYRISNNVGMWVLFPPGYFYDSEVDMSRLHNSNPFVVSTDSNITLDIGDQTRLPFEVTIHNREQNTAAGSRYYGNQIRLFVEPSADVSYPEGIMSVPSLVFTNDPSLNGPSFSQSYGLYFISAGIRRTYHVTIVFQERVYPQAEIYNVQCHVLLSLSFYVQVGGS